MCGVGMGGQAVALVAFWDGSRGRQGPGSGQGTPLECLTGRSGRDGGGSWPFLPGGG